MKVFLTSCETETGAVRRQEEMLRRLWSLSDRRHALVDSPREADMVIIGDIKGADWFASLRNHSVALKYPGKCFTLSDADRPMPLMRGIYASAHAGLKFRHRFRSGAYNLYHPDVLNPFIESYQDRAYEKPKRYLYSFAGRDSHKVRVAIFAARRGREDILIRQTSFNAWSGDGAAKPQERKEFKDILEGSKFALCPRGGGTSSIRLFEAMRMGVAPIILSDDWIFPKGPRWGEFALIIPERDVDRIEEIAVQNEQRYQEMGAAAAAAYKQYFSDASYFNYLVDQFADIRARQRIPERVFWSFRHMVVGYQQLLRDLEDLRWKIYHFMGRDLAQENSSGQGA